MRDVPRPDGLAVVRAHDPAGISRLRSYRPRGDFLIIPTRASTLFHPASSLSPGLCARMTRQRSTSWRGITFSGVLSARSGTRPAPRSCDRQPDVARGTPGQKRYRSVQPADLAGGRCSRAQLEKYMPPATGVSATRGSECCPSALRPARIGQCGGHRRIDLDRHFARREQRERK